MLLTTGRKVWRAVWIVTWHLLQCLKHTLVSSPDSLFLIKTSPDLWPICRCLGFCWLSVHVLRWHHWLFEDLLLTLKRPLNFQSQRPHEHGLLTRLVFMCRGEGMLQTGYCWRLTPDSALAGAWVEIMLGNLNCCQVGVREDHLICPFPTQLFSGICQVFVLSGLSLSGSHTNALRTLATSQICPSHVGGSYFHFHKVLCLLGLFSSFQSIYDWARLWFKQKTPQASLRTSFVSVIDLMVWAWGDCFVPALLVIFLAATVPFYLWRGACSSNFC